MFDRTSQVFLTKTHLDYTLFIPLGEEHLKTRAATYILKPSGLRMYSAPRPSRDIVWVKVSGHSDLLDTVNVYRHAGTRAPHLIHQLQSATGAFPSRIIMAGGFNLRSRLWEPGASNTAEARLFADYELGTSTETATKRYSGKRTPSARCLR
ncbi:hypothetical protein K470DRAFT_58148 [Piedraia hortae CBS 480.64]|uniref:Endonuclease/exonuclease/phosphatase domain-containing protein n=1 Tax=Piedraia hortae CBS 480.64 TaxID=1314780 RepID=A0A6A7C0M9_9PEZI|nr:hypothetical protein K470DRAFT_58148 [Piedraia hortae CBS 480.64]